MIIGNKEYRFLYSVRASLTISKMLPGNNLGKIADVLNAGDQVKNIDLILGMAIAMNEAYLRRQAYENGTEFDPNEVLKRSALEEMTMEELLALEDEVVSAYSVGNKTSVDAESAGKKRKEAVQTG